MVFNGTFLPNGGFSSHEPQSYGWFINKNYSPRFTSPSFFSEVLLPLASQLPPLPRGTPAALGAAAHRRSTHSLGWEAMAVWRYQQVLTFKVVYLQQSFI